MGFENFGVEEMDELDTSIYPTKEELIEEKEELKEKLRKVKNELKELKKSDKAKLKEKLENKKERIKEYLDKIQGLKEKNKELQKVEKEKQEIKKKKDRFKEKLGEKKKENLDLKQEVKRLKNDIPILEELKKKEKKRFKDLKELGKERKRKIIKKNLRKVGFPGDLGNLFDQYSLRNLLYLTGITKQFQDRSDIISKLKTFILQYNKKIWRETAKQDKEKYRKKYDYKIEVPGNKEFSLFFLEQLEEEVLTKGFKISIEKALDLVSKIYEKDNYYFRYKSTPKEKEEKKEELVKFLRNLKRKLILNLEAEEEKGSLEEEKEKEIKIEEPKEIEDRDYEIPIEKWNNLNEQQKKIFNILRKHKRRAEEGKTEFIFDSQTEYRETFNRETKHDLSKSRFSKLLKPIADKLRFKKDGKTIEPLKVEKKGRSKSYRLG